MDPLSDVLSLLKPRSYVVRGFDVAGQWSIQFAQHEGIKCYAVLSGQGWLSMDDVPDPVRLKTGDCLLLPRGRPFRLASDLGSHPGLRGCWCAGSEVSGAAADDSVSFDGTFCYFLPSPGTMSRWR